MKSIVKGASTLVLLSAISLTLLGFDVHTHRNPATNFAQYRTYSWLKVQMPHPIWEERAKTAIDQALAQKGWQRVDRGGDASIVANGTTSTKTKLSDFYSGVDSQWGWYGWTTAPAIPVQYEEGTLVVDMFDFATKQLIWRGTATETLSEKPEKNAEKFNHAVEKMFKKFPQ